MDGMQKIKAVRTTKIIGNRCCEAHLGIAFIEKQIIRALINALIEFAQYVWRKWTIFLTYSYWKISVYLNSDLCLKLSLVWVSLITAKLNEFLSSCLLFVSSQKTDVEPLYRLLFTRISILLNSLRFTEYLLNIFSGILYLKFWKHDLLIPCSNLL